MMSKNTHTKKITVSAYVDKRTARLVGNAIDCGVEIHDNGPMVSDTMRGLVSIGTEDRFPFMTPAAADDLAVALKEAAAIARGEKHSPASEVITSQMIEKLNHNELDFVVTRSDGTVAVSYFSTVKAREENVMPFVAISIDKVNGHALVSTSSCLPTSGWGPAIQAYARAMSFMHRSGLKDTKA